MQEQLMPFDGYIIDFKELNVGDYNFKFNVGESLFALYDGCEVMGGDCEVVVKMQRSESMLVLDVDIVGDVEVECDRCLDPCSVEIDYHAPLIVKFSDEEALANEFDGEVMWMSTAQSSLDLTHYIYESIILSLPYQRVHAEGECNAEMAAKFKIISGEEFDELEKQSEENDNEKMPPEALAKLQALKAKLENEK